MYTVTQLNTFLLVPSLFQNGGLTYSDLYHEWLDPFSNNNVCTSCHVAHCCFTKENEGNLPSFASLG